MNLAKSEQVIISLNNTLGQTVQALYEGAVNSGDFYQQIKLNDVHPAGVYYVNVTVGDDIFQHTLIIR